MVAIILDLQLDGEREGGGNTSVETNAHLETAQFADAKILNLEILVWPIIDLCYDKINLSSPPLPAPPCQ